MGAAAASASTAIGMPFVYDASVAEVAHFGLPLFVARLGIDEGSRTKAIGTLSAYLATTAAIGSIKSFLYWLSPALQSPSAR